MNKTTYTVLLVIVLVLHHALPYILRGSWTGWSLYAFWACLSATWLAVTVLALRRWLER